MQTAESGYVEVCDIETDFVSHCLHSLSGINLGQYFLGGKLGCFLFFFYSSTSPATLGPEGAQYSENQLFSCNEIQIFMAVLQGFDI